MKSHFPYYIEENDIEFIFKMCAMSTYVKKNFDYNKKASATKIFLDPSNVVNAYANSINLNSHTIKIMKGLCNISALVSTALVAFRNTGDVQILVQTFNLAGELANDNDGEFTEEILESALTKLNFGLSESLLRDVRSYFTGMVLSVVAHELGHICLSHTIREEDNHDVSRNDERQADLFAQSVISTTPFSSYLILSSLAIEIVFAWMGKNYTGPATTHPNSVERVHNILNSHETYLAEIGITKDNIGDFLP